MVLRPRLSRRGLARAALAFAGLTAGLGGAEWYCRERLPPPIAPSERFLRFMLENEAPLFQEVNAGGQQTLVQAPSVWRVVLSQRLQRRKASGVKRILVVGESSADMLGRELLDLHAATPSARWEVLDCAVGGGSLEQVRKRFDECVQYSPDAVILTFGHNLFYNHPESPRWLLSARLMARRSRLLTNLIERALWRPEPPPFDPGRRRLQLQEFIRYLGRRCRSKGISGLVLPLASNLWFTPASTEQERTAPDFLAAVYRYDSGRRREAAAALARALRRRPSALWHFVLGDWLLREGDEAGALRNLLLARDLDPSRRRASSAVNDTLRATAAAEGLRVFDGERWLSRRAPHGIPGWESFIDNQHASAAIFRVWAGDCLALLGAEKPQKSAGPDGPPPSDPAPPEIALRSAWGMASADPRTGSSVIYLAEQRFDPARPISDEVLRSIEADAAGRARLRLYLAEGAWRSGGRSAALAMNDLLRRQEPGWADPDVQRGLFMLESGRSDAAASSFREALRKSPGRKDAEFYLRAVAFGRVPETPPGAAAIRSVQ